MNHSTLVLLLLAVLAADLGWSCSVPVGSDFPPYTPGQRAVLAPVVLEAVVVNTTAPPEGPVHFPYKACVVVERKLKSAAEVQVPNELCFGDFGPEELCLQHVFPGGRFLFFLGADLTARYDGPVPVSVLLSTDEIRAVVEQGIPCGNSSGRDECDLPRIDASFPRSVVVAEGKETLVPCVASGTAPLVVTWTRRGHPAPQRGTSLLLSDVTVKDRGTYTCTVRNPAGEVRGKTAVYIVPAPCGKVIALGENESTTIQSPSFPDHYPRSKMCSWRVCPPKNKSLELAFSTFDLRPFDKLEIDNECDMHSNPWRTYCGTVNPGKLISRCPSGCVTIGMSSVDATNRQAKGFKAVITATEKEQAPFDVLKLYCDSELVLKVKPKGGSIGTQIQAEVLVNYKPGPPAVGDDVAIDSSFLGSNDLYGCLEKVDQGADYFVFTRPADEEPRDRLVSRFIAKHGSWKNPPNFQENLESYRKSPPQCP